MMVEQAGLGEHEGADAGRAHRRSLLGPLPKQIVIDGRERPLRPQHGTALTADQALAAALKAEPNEKPAALFLPVSGRSPGARKSLGLAAATLLP